jgi:hypothetical protein
MSLPARENPGLTALWGSHFWLQAAFQAAFSPLSFFPAVPF